MLFLRKIRNKMIKESKIGQYLLYAVGEIFLVVIGILIAVQIDDWNGNRKNIEVVEKYKKSLVQDLQKDSFLINEIINDISNDLKYLENIEARLSAPSANADTLFTIVRRESNKYLIIQAFFDFNSNTRREMISSGKMSMLDDTLKTRVLNLGQLQSQIVLSSEILLNSYIASLNTFSSKFLTDYSVSAVKKGPLLDQFWLEVDEIELLTNFNGIIMQKGDYYRVILPALQKAQTQTHDLLELLK